MRLLYITELIRHGGGGKATENLVVEMANNTFLSVGLFCIGEPRVKESNFIHFNSKAKTAISLKYMSDLFITVKSFKPEIIHAMGLYTGILALFARRLFCRESKVLVTLHHTSENFRFSFISKKIIRILNKSDVILYLSNFQRDLYSKYGLIPSVSYLMPNIVRKKSFSQEAIDRIRRNLLIKTDSKYLVNYVGRLEESKQIDMFIRVIAILREDGYPVGGIIVGRGDPSYEERLRKLVSNVNMEGSIKFIGFVDDPEIYISASDCGLFPTLWKEGLPNYIVESFSLGKILVTSNIPQLHGLIKDGINSLVAKEHTVEEYCSQIKKIFIDENQRKRMEKEAMENYIHVYSPEVVFEKYLRVISKVTGKDIVSIKGDFKCVSA